MIIVKIENQYYNLKFLELFTLLFFKYILITRIFIINSISSKTVKYFLIFLLLQLSKNYLLEKIN